MRIVIFGAGSVGCFVGACWQSAGLDVGYIGRSSIAREIAENGLKVTDFAGWQKSVAPQDVDYCDDPEKLSSADLVVICVKCTATEDAARLIDEYSGQDAAVLSLQNGISNVGMIRKALKGRTILAGMTGFNVVHQAPGHWHKSTSGFLVADGNRLTREIAAATSDTAASLTLSADMNAVAWGKLLLNLNNPVNALSGKLLAEQLMDRRYRRVLAASIREAVSILRAANIRPARITPLPPRLLAPFIDTPNWFFNTVGLRLQKIDANARSSMADDFDANRQTEIDFLNGEIVRLAKDRGLEAPVNAKICELVKEAEDGGKRIWTAGELVKATDTG